MPGKPQGQEEIDRKKLGAVVFSDPKSMSVRALFRYHLLSVISLARVILHILDSSSFVTLFKKMSHSILFDTVIRAHCLAACQNRDPKAN